MGWETALIVAATSLGTAAATGGFGGKGGLKIPRAQPVARPPGEAELAAEKARAGAFTGLQKLKRATLLSQRGQPEPLLKKTVLGVG